MQRIAFLIFLFLNGKGDFLYKIWYFWCTVKKIERNLYYREIIGITVK